MQERYRTSHNLFNIAWKNEKQVLKAKRQYLPRHGVEKYVRSTYIAKLIMHIRNGPLIYSEIYTRTHRRVVNAPVFLCHCIRMYVHIHMAATPAHYECHGMGRGVRSLNFDPETTAWPLCAWPSTTGRQGTYIMHAMTGRANERSKRSS